MLHLGFRWICSHVLVVMESGFYAALHARSTYGTSFFFQDGPFVLYHNGRRLDNPSPLPESANVDAVLTLVGGKGGFGAMLRALGAQIDKTTNREACRDLSGRRLRDVNEEDRLRK